MGSLRTLSFVAWLSDDEFTLDVYVPSIETPLPAAPEGWGSPSHIALDVPQGLPAVGSFRREADQKANTPTRRLPANRAQLQDWGLYRGLVEAGVEMFWAMHERRLAQIFGLETTVSGPVAMETYPRYVIKRLWPALRIPSKRREPFQYVDAVWRLVREQGYFCASVARPTVDQVDAVVCALAAEAATEGKTPACTVGIPPVVDKEGRVIREGTSSARSRRRGAELRTPS